MPRERYSEVKKRQELDKKVDQFEVVDLYLSGMTVKDIAQETSLTEYKVKELITELDSQITEKMLVLAEQITIRNLARAEQLISTHYLEAIESKDVRQSKMVLDLLRFEQDLVKSMKENAPKEETNHRDVLEGTLGSKDDLYHEATKQMKADWLEKKEPLLNQLLDNPPDFPDLPLPDELNYDNGTDD